MQKVIIIKYAELFLKGKNKGYFEQMFFVNIERALKGYKHTLRRPSGRYIVADFNEAEEENILVALKKVFGAHTISAGYETSSALEDIFEAAKSLAPENGTFKVESHRGDKKYPLTSIEISREIGGRLLEAFPALSVDVHTPQHIIRVDVRENGAALVSGKDEAGAGGMPVGTGGKGLLLISGGIDSPVAGYMMAKRGMKVDCLHFNSYPYTNEQAKEKVVELAQILSEYTLGTKLNVVSVTHIQEKIHEKCAPELMITLLRRFMYRIAERYAKKIGAQCLITGESLGQVASQTMDAICCTDKVCEMPVFRPLIGNDKDEIITVSRKIGAFETSILPFEDCCTVFTPKHPRTKPRLDMIEKAEQALDIDGLIKRAVDGVRLEIIR